MPLFYYSRAIDKRRFISTMGKVSTLKSRVLLRRTIEKVSKKESEPRLERRGIKKLLLYKVIMNIKPLGDRVLIQALSQEEREGKTASGIVIPDTAEKERPEEGRVVAIGPGKKSEEGVLVPVTGVKVGDRVLFSKYGPNEIKVDGKEYLIAREEDILAVIEQ